MNLIGEKYKESFDEHFPKFCKYIKADQKLMHLNMTATNLPKEYYMELIRNLKRSQSLHCVHLCGNIQDEEVVDLMNNKLKPTFINQMITNSRKLASKKQLI